MTVKDTHRQTNKSSDVLRWPRNVAHVE